MVRYVLCYWEFIDHLCSEIPRVRKNIHGQGGFHQLRLYKLKLVFMQILLKIICVYASSVKNKIFKVHQLILNWVHSFSTPPIPRDQKEHPDAYFDGQIGVNKTSSLRPQCLVYCENKRSESDAILSRIPFLPFISQRVLSKLFQIPVRWRHLSQIKLCNRL